MSDEITEPELTAAALELRDEVREVVRRQYLDSDERPWVVSYSGGKDSTLLAHLVFEAMAAVRPSKRTRRVYFVCSDTRVETPELAEHVHTSVAAIGAAARAQNLPATAHVVTPPVPESFWVRIIGHGYPPPSRLFRWCTDRMKINPSNAFVREHVEPDGKVLLLVGARDDESHTRSKSLARHNIASTFQTHRRLPRALIWAPIRDLTTDEVWRILIFTPPPWGGSHVPLRNLYKDAHAGECFLVTQEGTDPCGNSRFGCWTCTVVERDRSLEGLIASGRDYGKLSEFRDYLIQIRDSRHEFREERRKNGQPGIGPLRMHVREDLLKQLLGLEQELGLQLITPDEISAIRLAWIAESIDRGPVGDTPPALAHMGE